VEKNEKIFDSAEKILNNKPRIDPFRFLSHNPVEEVDEFQATNGDTRFIRKTTLANSKDVHEVFENWVNHIYGKKSPEN